MIAVVFIAAGGAVILGLVLGSRWTSALAWRRSLVALSVQFPRAMKADELTAWLAMIGSMRVTVALEIVATQGHIAHYLLVPKTRRADLVTGTRAILTRLRLEDADKYLAERPAGRVATELRITHLSHQLATERVEGAAAAMLGSLGQVSQSETVVVQWLIHGVRTPKPRAANDPARELARAERVKHGRPLLEASGRVAVKAATTGRAWAMLNRVVGTLRILDAPGVAVVRGSAPSGLVLGRLAARAWPLVRWPVVVNAAEGAGLIAVPLGAVSAPGLILGRSRQLPPPAQMPRRGGAELAASNYPGMAGRALTLRPSDRLHHVYLVGPTGVGKSNLLATMALGDMAAGYGLCLLDVKGDLVEAILERIPDEAAERVIVLDPSQTDRPVGLNPLSVPGADEAARELAADRVLHIFRDLFRSHWGPRTDDVLRAALLTLVSVPAPNGQAFTVCEIPELLSRPTLRRYATSHPGLPEALRTYWAWFDGMSEAEQLAHVGPVMNKLRAFTMRSATRLMLGQSQGLDLSEVMRRQQVLVVALAKGRIGTETATLAGSLIVSAFWQAALGRINVAPERRRPFFLFLDEFQDMVRTSESLPDLLSQARGLGIGAVLANQYLAQLPETVRAAVLGTVRTQVVFQVEYDDAHLLERRFAPNLAADDLMGLERYEIAMRPCVDGQTALPVTGTTLPLKDAVRDGAELARAARVRYGRARADVEADLIGRMGPGGEPGRVGRVYRRRGV